MLGEFARDPPRAGHDRDHRIDSQGRGKDRSVHYVETADVVGLTRRGYDRRRRVRSHARGSHRVERLEPEVFRFQPGTLDRRAAVVPTDHGQARELRIDLDRARGKVDVGRPRDPVADRFNVFLAEPVADSRPRASGPNTPLRACLLYTSPSPRDS